MRTRTYRNTLGLFHNLECCHKGKEGEYSARCPAHDDERNSLSFREAADRILVNCHAGCSVEAICSAMGITIDDLFLDNKPTATKSEIVAIYDYRSTTGRLMYQVVRFRPKAFVQRRPSGAKKDDWIWNISGVDRLLYRLPELVHEKEEDKPVYIPEGEKDVDVLRNLGLVATCNSGGAGKWLDHFGEHLKNRDIVILPDNDHPGRKHAEDIAESLWGRVKTIKVIDLPGLPEKGDVSDWLARGGTLEELQKLTTDCPPWKPQPKSKAIPDYDHDKVLEVVKDFPCTEWGTAQRLVARFGVCLRYCVMHKAWYYYKTCGVWAEDKESKTEDLVKKTVTFLPLEMSAADTDRRGELNKWIKQCHKYTTQRAILNLAGSEEGIPIMPNIFDRDPYRLACLNGTIDLHTGQIGESKPEYYITRLAEVEYAPEARSELWDSFLERVLPDQEIRDFVQCAAGYSICGDTSEEKLFFIHGPTASGKSTFLEAIEATLSDYARKANPETFIRMRSGAGASEDIARLAGVRFVYTNEINRGERMAEGLLKAITGGDTIVARYLYQGSFQFKPQLTLWLAVNHTPKVSGDDDAIWRRIVRVPFEQSIPEAERDPKIKKALATKDKNKHSAAILAWLVKGCLTWQKYGLQVPPAVRVATETYREEMNPFKGFFDEVLVFDPALWSRSRAIIEAYTKWAKANRIHEPESNKALGMALKEKGCVEERIPDARGWRGVGLNAEFAPAEAPHYSEPGEQTPF